tara:strand:+ start:6977 stop:7909 length:933 start_codon:yes stop_codon:yes gene_type:complete
MDIDEYLRRKRELEKQKDQLEAEEAKSKKESIKLPKKDIEIKRRMEIEKSAPKKPAKPSRGRGADYPEKEHRGFGESVRWIVLGLAFFAALIFVGIYLISTPSDSEESESQDFQELQKQIEELQKSLDEAPAIEEADELGGVVDETGEVNEEDVGPGPEFSFYIEDDWDDENSIGIFDSSGKIEGSVVDIWMDSLTPIYKYRLVVENKEASRVLCKIDEEIKIDIDLDGDYDDETYKLDLQVIKLDSYEKESIKDSLMAEGSITGIYETRCYFCEDQKCDKVYTAGEEIGFARFKALLHSETINETNSSE